MVPLVLVVLGAQTGFLPQFFFQFPLINKWASSGKTSKGQEYSEN